MGMSSTTSTGAASFSLDPKARFVLPIEIRRAAGVSEGAVLVVRAIGEGRILIETREAISARVWASAPALTEVDSVADTRDMRDEDAQISDAAAKRRSRLTKNDQDDVVGAVLLQRLGL